MGDERRDEGDNHEAKSSQPPLSPTRAFAVLAMIALVGGLIVASATWNPSEDVPADTQPSPQPTPDRVRSPSASPDGGGDPVLSRSEALSLFADLRHGLERAYRKRDLVLLGNVVRRGSPQFDRSRKDIRLLERTNLLDRTSVRTLKLTLISSEPDVIVVSERALVRPRYIDDATYVEVDVDLVPTTTTSEWTIERVGETWSIVSGEQG